MCVGGRVCNIVSMVTIMVRSFQLPGDACMFSMLHFLHAGETAVHALNVHPFASTDYLMVFLVVLSLLTVLYMIVFPTGLLS